MRTGRDEVEPGHRVIRRLYHASMQHHLVARSIGLGGVEVYPRVCQWGRRVSAAQRENRHLTLNRNTARRHSYTFRAEEGCLAAMEQLNRGLERGAIWVLHGCHLLFEVTPAWT